MARGGDEATPPAFRDRSDHDVAGESPRPTLALVGAPLSLSLTATAEGLVGRAPDDTIVRMIVRPLPHTDDGARLCSAIAAGPRTPTQAPWGLPLDTTAPQLLRRTLSTDAVRGVRFVVPGVQSMWAFEGVTTRSRQQVSVRWPIRSDPATPIPVGAPDSVIERALTPRPRQLDSVVLALRDTATAARETATRATRIEANATQSSLRPSRAVLLYSDLPVHEIVLSDACPEATFSLPMIARADQLLRIPVERGDRIDAMASVEYGQVRLSFDEVAPGPDAPSSPLARATAVAASDDRLTLRAVLITAPRQQRADQVVLLSLTRRR